MFPLFFRGQEAQALNLSYPWVKLKVPITPVYCHSPLYTIFSLISSLNFHMNHSRAVLHIPSNPIPCIAFVLQDIPVPFYIYLVLLCIVFVLPYIPLRFYICALLLCIVFVLPYIPLPLYIHPIVFNLKLAFPGANLHIRPQR